MPPSITPQGFITKWDRASLNERATAHEHFIDLCGLLRVPTPNEADPDGAFYRFEKPLTKAGGGAGYADVWYKHRFAWEYKTKGKYPDLTAAYQQLLLYKGDLENPPVLIACDLAQFEVHIEFTGYRSRTERFGNDHLQNASTRELLHLAFTDVEQLRPRERTTTITEEAAARFARVAQLLEGRGYTPAQIAPFFTKVLFALFAEDIRLLPAELLTRSIRQSIFNADEFPDRAQSLFRAMRDGGYFGLDRIPRFNGSLFANDEALPLNATELQYLADVANLDWSRVEPAIFGTLFEHSLDERLRAQLGIHYTSKEDILLLVEPVLMTPLRCEWEGVKGAVETMRPQWERAVGTSKQRLRGQMEGLIFAFMERLSQTKTLDAAAGSGNFLYVALTLLKDLEKEVRTYAAGVGLTEPELGVTPKQFYGIEKSMLAAQMAQVVLWIGYLQWNYHNGFWGYSEPILQALDTIQCRDAILDFDSQGNPVEPEWPDVDVLVGNPPFLGAKWMQRELGEVYKQALWKVYEGRVLHTSDLVMYWFEKSRAAVEAKQIQRVGLLATNTVSKGGSVFTLKRIKETGDIFFAQTGVPWKLPGANLRVALIGFDGGTETEKVLNGQPVLKIEPDLSAGLSLDNAQPLSENLSLSFRGHERGGPFVVSEHQAIEFLTQPENAEVVFKWFSGLDLTQQAQHEWIIDFGMRGIEEAQQYKEPFEYLRNQWLQEAKAGTPQAHRAIPRTKWWRHRRPATDLRDTLHELERFIVTPLVSKYRLFVWLEVSVRPDTRLVAFSRADDYFLGVRTFASRYKLFVYRTFVHRQEIGDVYERMVYSPPGTIRNKIAVQVV